jgi:hypothetical protein
MVSHLEFDAKLLKNIRPLGVFAIVAAIAGFTRVTAPLVSYKRHLAYAGLLSVAALIYWGFIFFVKNHDKKMST